MAPEFVATNRMNGAKAPSKYLGDIQSHKQVQIDDEAVNAILESHRINPERLRNEDFERFMAARAEALLTLVERAMGKSSADVETDGDDSEDELPLLAAMND